MMHSAPIMPERAEDVEDLPSVALGGIHDY
jgi:hypothetical protein